MKEHLIVSLFKPLLDYRSEREAIAYLFQHPVLTSPYYTDLLQVWANTLSGKQQQAAVRAIALKTNVYERVRSGKLKMPAITNPLTKLFADVLEGRITQVYAEKKASQPEFFCELIHPVIGDTCGYAETIMLKDWRPAVALVKIMLAALNARREQIPENQQSMDISAAETLLGVASTALNDVPDGRLYREAVRRSEPLADVIDEGREPQGQILHRLGVLHLDPYVGGRSDKQLNQQLRAWQTRMDEEFGQQLATVPKDQRYMPPIAEALPKAAAYFRRALALRSGEPRGRTLKALAQALLWSDIIGLQIDPEEMVAIAREAIPLLPADCFQAEHAELEGIVARFSKGNKVATPLAAAHTTSAGGPAAQLAPALADDPVATAQKILQTPVDAWVNRIGLLQTCDTFKQSAQAVADADPMLAFRLITAIWALMETRPEADRRAYLDVVYTAVRRALVPDAPQANGKPVRPIIEALYQNAGQKKWPSLRIAYHLLWLALSSTQTDQEEEGLEALRACAECDDGSDGLLSVLLPGAFATLYTGTAVNAYNRHDIPAAARWYAEAMGRQLEAGFPSAALDTVGRLLDLAKPDQVEAVEALIAALSANALPLERATGIAGTELIQAACRHALAVLSAGGPFSDVALFLLLDVAKGRRFRAALAQPPGTDWLNDDRLRNLERELAKVRAEARLEAPSDPPVLDIHDLLTSYVSPKEMQGGGTATEQLRNLQIQFDTLLDRRLSGGTGEDPWVPSLDYVQSLLDDSTVLAVQYLGAASNGAVSLNTLLATREHYFVTSGILPSVPSSTVVLSVGEEQVTAHITSLLVSDLRRKLCSPPGPRVADSAALHALESDVQTLLGGGIRDALSAYRAQGKDHLCFCPHGPFHYFPFHLLGPEDKPLAGDWCITYLPNLRLLSREPLPPANGSAELTAIGLDFDEKNVHGLSELIGPEEEVTTIAKVYRARPLTGAAVTESAVLSALAKSRKVHIATHGAHNVSAPAFQCMYVRPDRHSDGIIHAYELLRLDLRKLDLITMSACETALGRIDQGDNLRGIPAALLIAGVHTIVGTLWPVETNTATAFFEVFYQRLRESGSKLTAFYDAQKQTRQRFPEYRDWGAFQLIGSWR